MDVIPGIYRTRCDLIVEVIATNGDALILPFEVRYKNDRIATVSRNGLEYSFGTRSDYDLIEYLPPDKYPYLYL